MSNQMLTIHQATTIRPAINDAIYKAVTAHFLTVAVGFEAFQDLDTEPHINDMYEDYGTGDVDSMIADIAESAIGNVMYVLDTVTGRKRNDIKRLFDDQANAIFGEDFDKLEPAQRRSIKLMLHGAVYGQTVEQLIKAIDDDT